MGRVIMARPVLIAAILKVLRHMPHFDSGCIFQPLP